MDNQMIVCKNHIYQVHCNDGIQLNVRDYMVDTSSLTVKLERKFQWGCKTNFRILAASSAREAFSGSVIPFVLVAMENKKQCSTEIKCYILCLEAENVFALKMLKIKQEFVSFSHSNVSCSTLRLLDGPAALVHGADGIMFYSSQDTCVLQSCFYQYKTMDLLPYNACCKDAKVKSCDNVEFVQTYSKVNRHTVFSCMELATSCPIHQDKLLKVLHACVIENNKFCDIHIGKFVPIEYMNTVSCLCVQTIYNDSNFSSRLFIGTADGFVLHICNGHVMNCISLSETFQSDSAFNMDGNSISSIHYSAPVGGKEGQVKLLISQMKETELKVLNKEFKIENTYKDVQKVFKGDFAQNGTTQFLLMKDTDFENAEWILTDLFSVNLCNEADAKQPTGGDLIQSCGTVVQALRSRLQKETMDVEEQSKYCEERVSFMREICARYNPSSRTARDWRLTSQQASLVPLVTGCHGNKGLRQSSVFGDMPAVRVKELWQRTYRGQWCIGADLVNKSDRDVQVLLTVIHCKGTDHRSIQCHSKLTQCSIKPTDSNSLISVQSDPKKRKLLGMIERTVTSPQPSTGTNVGHCTAVCVSPLPDFSVSDQCSVFVILYLSTPLSGTECPTGLESPGGDVVNKVSIGSRESWQMPCGQIILYSRDVVCGRHEVKLGASLKNDGDFQELKDLQRDQIAWREAQTLTQVVMRSSSGTLAGLDKLLTDKCGLVYSTGLDCYYTMQEGLQNVQLALGPVQYLNKRDIDIFYSCDRDLFLMIHHLYNCLPDHILILPRDTKTSMLKQNFLFSMGKEIHILSDGITKLLNLNETQVVKSDPDSEQEDCTRKVGEKFKISREKLMKKQAVPLDRVRMLELNREEAELQRKTDLALAMCELR